MLAHQQIIVKMALYLIEAKEKRVEIKKAKCKHLAFLGVSLKIKR